jgi:formylglycine-generating enzyme
MRLPTFQTTATKSKTNTGEMVLVKGGSFQMGSVEFNDAKPVHNVLVSGFYMDVHEVTNAEFSEFVKATGYITTAERMPRKEDYPDVPVGKLVKGSAVFSPPSYPVSLDNPLLWWQYIPGANWKHPHGVNSNISGKDNEPVVQVSYTDAVAYAKWAGKRLPTEAEWEYAARAGHQYKEYYWGNELKQDHRWQANIFQGEFPFRNSCDDGFAGIAPVKSFPANSYGLYDMEGNVWEWCSDLYGFDYYESSPGTNPKGPEVSDDPDEPDVEIHVQRGGSFLCSDLYCERYKAGSRGKGETHSSGDNLGFRCVKDVVIRKLSFRSPD